MITVASVDYCERCRCKTLHVPMPSGERVCEYHLGDAPPEPRAPEPRKEETPHREP